MRRIILALAISVIATTSMFAGSALASGPAPPGKEIQEVECGGRTITISVPRPEKSRGAAQVVGQKGHGILVSAKFSVTDVTTSTLLFTESLAVGGGHAHPNQPTTPCSATFFEGPASVFFEGHERPPGVEPSHVIRASSEVQVIVKR